MVKCINCYKCNQDGGTAEPCRCDEVSESTETAGYAPDLNDLFSLYKWDADLMRCRECNRGIIVHRSNEEMVHAAGCKSAGKFGMLNPWHAMKMMIA